MTLYATPVLQKVVRWRGVLTAVVIAGVTAAVVVGPGFAGTRSEALAQDPAEEGVVAVSSMVLERGGAALTNPGGGAQDGSADAGADADDAPGIEGRDGPSPAPQGGDLRERVWQRPDDVIAAALTCEGIEVPVGADLTAAVEDAPEGASLCIGSGVHRLADTLFPKAGQRLVGAPGAVLSGSKVLTGFVQDGDEWFVDGQTQRFKVHGSCDDPACDRPEDVFIDGRPLRQVLSRDQLGPDRFYFDYDRDRIYVGDDPSGRHIEATAVDTAVRGREGADGVLLAGLVIEQFANVAQRGAVDVRDTFDWRIVGNEVRNNHGVGVYSGTRSQVIGNHVHHNGQLGMGGTGDDMLIEGNEINNNNTQGYSLGWEAGGSKWSSTTGLVIRNNYSHHNDGAGLWTDIDNVDTLYAGNIVEHNTTAGIWHEISYAAEIRDNRIRWNGLELDHPWAYGAGIQISASQDVEIHGNLVEGNSNQISLIMQERGTGAHGRYEIANVTVRNNHVIADDGWVNLSQDIGDLSYFDPAIKNNRFEGNTYTIGPDVAFRWLDRRVSPEEWQALGNDRDGSIQLQ